TTSKRRSPKSMRRTVRSTGTSKARSASMRRGARHCKLVISNSAAPARAGIMAAKGIGFDTLSLHAGQRPDPSTGARATPIYQSAAFVFPDTDFAAGLFNIERAGHVYSRLSNPTNAVLEERVTALEGGVGAIATASGQAAMHLAIATLC